MTLRDVLTVFRRECLSASRDRRALYSSLGYAVLGPAVLAMALSVALQRDSEPQVFRLVVQSAPYDRGQDDIADLMDRLQGSQMVLAASDDAEASVARRDALVGLVIGPGSQESIDAGGQAKVAVAFDATHRNARSAVDRVRGIVATWASDIAAGRLIRRGVAPSVISPVRISERDLASPEARAGLVLGALPLFILMAVFVCGLPAALDGTAGERERGSLEPLLLSPVDRGSIAVGKWLAASILAALGALVALLASIVAFRIPALQEMPFALGGREVWAILVILLPVALMVSAVQSFLGLQSKTFKEAQAQGNLLMMVPMVPGFLIAFGASLPAAVALTPILGHQMLIEQLLKGQTPAFSTAAFLCLTTIALALALVALMARQLDREATRLT